METPHEFWLKVTQRRRCPNGLALKFQSYYPLVALDTLYHVYNTNLLLSVQLQFLKKKIINYDFALVGLLKCRILAILRCILVCTTLYFGVHMAKKVFIYLVRSLFYCNDSIHVISFKKASGRFSFHFREVYQKCIGKFLIQMREASKSW